VESSLYQPNVVILTLGMDHAYMYTHLQYMHYPLTCSSNYGSSFYTIDNNDVQLISLTFYI